MGGTDLTGEIPVLSHSTDKERGPKERRGLALSLMVDRVTMPLDPNQRKEATLVHE